MLASKEGLVELGPIRGPMNDLAVGNLRHPTIPPTGIHENGVHAAAHSLPFRFGHQRRTLGRPGRLVMEVSYRQSRLTPNVTFS
jgi:hypothetical protein